MKYLLCVGLFALACSKGGEAQDAQDPISVSEPAPPPVAPKAPQCTDEDGEVVQCETDDECCDGFVCGKDPERNPRLKYCVFGG